jgi:lipopolysaccharide/colanic/teichoic acid biosynthesis glycosyltransferase
MIAANHRRLLIGAAGAATAALGAILLLLDPEGYFASLALVLLGLALLLSVALAGRVHGERVVLLGNGAVARRLLAEIEARPELGWHVTCVPEVDAAIVAPGVDRIIVALADRRGHLPVRALLKERVRGVRVEEASAVYERLTGKLALESLRAGDLLFSDGFKTSRAQRAAARALSVAAALVGLACLAPLFPIVALAIKLDSRGPIFFHQTRVGLCGRPFDLVKLRTMRPAAHGSEWEIDNVSRLTRVGRWLRRLHIDELPQLWNILRGDMNLVGPRPHPLANAEMFGRRIPFYELRSLVRPGLTGWAQVRYRYANSLEEEVEKMCYDLYYIRHRSLWLDLRVLPATVHRLLARHAAEPGPGPVATPAHGQQGGHR